MANERNERTVYEYYWEGPVKYYCCRCRKYMGGSPRKKIRVYEVDIVTRYPKVSVAVDEEGYFHKKDEACAPCKEIIRQEKIARIKKRIKTVVIVVLIVAAVVAALCVGNALLTGGGMQERVFNKLVKDCESNPNLTAVEPTGAVGAEALEQMLGNLADGDYLLHLNSEKGSAEIQKHTFNGTTTYYWAFKKGFGEFSNKTYIWEDEVLYERGDENVAYYSSSAEYAELLEKLKAFWPENYCGKGEYTSESKLDDAEKQITANLIYGEGVTCLYYDRLEDEEGEENATYYEKSDSMFLRLELDEPSEGSAIAGKTAVSEYREVK